MRLSRLSRTAEGQLTTALEPLHDHLALAPVRPSVLLQHHACTCLGPAAVLPLCKACPTLTLWHAAWLLTATRQSPHQR